nr:hypothetical protein BaRGS_006849 [Batillaria attramentaria]
MLQDLRRETDRLVALWKESVEVQVWKSDDVKDVVIAKINWSENLARVQRLLKAEKVKGQQLHAEKVRDQQKLQEMKVSQQQLEAEKVKAQQQLQAERVKGQQQLQAEKRRAEAELAALYHTHQEEKTRERERVKRFYTGIQQKKTSLLKQVMKRIEEKDVLSKLVQQLCEEFDVRLLAIDSGLRFLMDVPIEEWKGVKELQEKLKKVLEGALLLKQEETEVTWTEVTSCNNKRLYQLDVSGHPTVVSLVQTARQYYGMSTGTTDDTLIVSCGRPATVDVITREDMEFPRQVCADPSGNVYIACSGSSRLRRKIGTNAG